MAGKLWLHRHENGQSEWLPYKPCHGEENKRGQKTNPWHNPLRSFGMGCHSSDAKEMNQRSKKREFAVFATMKRTDDARLPAVEAGRKS